MEILVAILGAVVVVLAGLLLWLLLGRRAPASQGSEQLVQLLSERFAPFGPG